METNVVILLLSLIFVLIASVKTVKYVQSFLLILELSVLFYVFTDTGLISIPFIENVSVFSLTIYLFTLSFLVSLMTRTEMVVKRKLKEEDRGNSSIKREKWNTYMLLVYWFFWALILTLFIQMNLHGLLIAILMIIVAVIMFLIWIKFEERYIKSFSITMTLLSLMLFWYLLF